MFDLYLTDEVNLYLKRVKKELRKKGYRECISTTNRHIGGIYLYYKTSNFIKGDLVFEFELDKVNNIVSTHMWVKDNNLESRKIMLSEVLELA